MGSYDEDFYEWTAQTAAALREGRFADVDVENVAEEIESMGRRDLHELKRRLQQILEHKLKLELLHGLVLEENQPAWRQSIRNQQRELDILLEDSPSLRRMIPDSLPVAYRRAAKSFTEDFGQSAPDTCPWTVDELL
jgi:hypothetical protein